MDDINFLAFLSFTQNSFTLLLLAQNKQATIHYLVTVLATSKNVLFPDHNHPLTIGADDPAF